MQMLQRFREHLTWITGSISICVYMLTKSPINTDLVAA
jgi:hypothetical protein